ncbi:unnamed protein product [Lymnaea stagnalis]|uniref:Aminoglycoside phosphotransferase domain-containing protein n=1 Tax=Lymnaea stagnalis TaxID=6523 RepID=A0AAV2H3E2_LYMST
MANLFRSTLSPVDIQSIVFKLYGLKVKVVKELNSYDDQNFLMVAAQDFPPPDYLTKFLSPHGYVIKILNSLDSRKPMVIETQNQIIHHTKKSGYPTPSLVPCIDGSYQVELEQQSTIPGPQHKSRHDDDTVKEKNIVRMFSYIPGKTLDQVQLTLQLCFEIGWYAAKMDAILKDFPINKYTVLKEMTRKWNMTEITELGSKIPVINLNSEQMNLITTVLNQFETNILSCQDQFSKGLIHSDFNECNILVNQQDSENPVIAEEFKTFITSLNSFSKDLKLKGDKDGNVKCHISKGTYHICGILDFGDCTHSLYMFEIAIAMTYVMLNQHGVDPMAAACHVLAGYTKQMSLSDVEVQHLKLCICARLVQSLVMGYFSFSQDTGNDYILTHAQRVWPILKRMWEAQDSEVYHHFKQFVHLL